MEKIISLFDGNDIEKLNDDEQKAALYISQQFKSETLRRYFRSKPSNRHLFPIYSFSTMGEFTFSIDDKLKKFSEIEASLLSKAAKRLILNENVNFLRISSEGFPKKDFYTAVNAYFDILEGNTLPIAHNNVQIYISIAKQFENTELANFCQNFITGPKSSYIKHYASYFSTIPIKELLELPPEFIEKVLSHPKLSVSSPNDVVEFLLKYTKSHGPQSHFLFDCVDFTKVDNSLIEQCFNNFPLPLASQRRLFSYLSKGGNRSIAIKPNEFSKKVHGNANFTLTDLKALLRVTDLAQVNMLANLFYGTQLKYKKKLITFLESQNSPLLVVLLACSYLGGLNAQKDQEKAFELFQSAKASGIVEATFWLGYCYEFGYGVGRNSKEAFGLLMEAFEAGHPRAAWELGNMYFVGRDVEKDNAKEFAFHLAAFERGYDDVAGFAYSLGLGRGVKRDYDLALCFIEQAKRKGFDCTDLEERVKSLKAGGKS